MSEPPPPDFSRGWVGSKWYDPDMTPEERADVEAIVAGVGVYVPRPPPIDPREAEPAAAAERKPARKAGRRGRWANSGPPLC